MCSCRVLGPGAALAARSTLASHQKLLNCPKTM
jgi:hypothetical protein